jgi:hypothetical protein
MQKFAYVGFAVAVIGLWLIFNGIARNRAA